MEIEKINQLVQQIREANKVPGKDDLLLKKNQGRLELIYGLYGRDSTGAEIRKSSVDVFGQSIKEILALPPAEFERFMNDLFPKIGKYVIAAFRGSKTIPYQRHRLWSAGPPFRLGKNGDRYMAKEDEQEFIVWKFIQILHLTLPFRDQDIIWFCEHLAYIRESYYSFGQNSLWSVIVPALEEGTDTSKRIFEILVASIKGTHEIGQPTQQAYAALLSSNLPAAWEVVEQMLKSAQREEGLRQQILDVADLSHPTEFPRMLALILELDLVRFSSVVQAVNLWFGQLWDSQATTQVRKLVQTVLTFLNDQNAAYTAIKTGTAQEAFFALYAISFHDVGDAIEAADSLLKHTNTEHRFAAVIILSATKLTGANRLLLPLVDDPELAVAYYAINSIALKEELKDELAAKLKLSLNRWPKKKEVSGLLFPWMNCSMQKEDIAFRTVTENEEDLLVAIPFVEEMSASRRSSIMNTWALRKPKPNHYREFLLHFSADANGDICKEVYNRLHSLQPSLTESELISVEEHLKRGAAKLRAEIIQLLRRQSDPIALASAARLLASKTPAQRTASLELLRQLVEKKRVVAECRALALTYKNSQEHLKDDEQLQLTAILGEMGTKSAGVPLAEQWCFGLAQEKDLTPTERPKKAAVEVTTKASENCLKSLLELVESQKDVPVKIHHSAEEVPFGRKEFWLPQPSTSKSMEENRESFYLSEVWEKWDRERNDSHRDKDGLELVRAWTPPTQSTNLLMQAGNLLKSLLTTDSSKEKNPYLGKARWVLEWLLYLNPPVGVNDFFAEVIIHDIADVTEEGLRASKKNHAADFAYGNVRHLEVLTSSQAIRNLYSTLNPQLKINLWKALNYYYTLLRKVNTRELQFTPLSITLRAWAEGIASDADLLNQLLFNQNRDRTDDDTGWKRDISIVTQQNIPVLYKEIGPRLRELTNRIVDRILEIELARGEKETPVTKIIEDISSISGLNRLLPILNIMKKLKLLRNSTGYWSNLKTREDVFSHLIGISHPTAEELADLEGSAKKLGAAGIKEQRLVEVAMLSPQWAPIIEKTLEWPQLNNTVWWFHAHTKESSWSTPKDVTERWTKEVSLRSPLSTQEFNDGAVDVDWFYECYKSLGEERLEELYKAAKFTCSNIGHARARVYCDALRSALSPTELIAQIEDKRNQDKVRALGLIPLSKERESAEEDVLIRYKALEEFQRGSKQFGAQRRTSEARAAEIALDNLARTAGYPDPLRLRWAMEIKSLADLRGGSKTITRDDVTVTLQIDELGDSEIIVTKDGKSQKSIPASLKKDPEIVELGTRRGELRKQVSRVRRSLEESMIRGDLFQGRELRSLSDHPLLAPIMTGLVFLSSDGNLGWLLEGGSSLRDAQGATTEIDPEDQLRIAHPCDFFASGDWASWQRDCFVHEIVQPFKQVFRELYLPTEREKEEGRRDTTRYAGHQLQPRQALGLLGSRNWIVDYEDGGVRKTWYKENLNAWITFEQYFQSPADVEGITVNSVSFTTRGEWESKLLKDVPPRVFSETMRDVDLVVSVAHRAGADPESSESSIEARGALVRETAAALRLQNVTLEKRYVKINGELAQYTVHLGSAEAAVNPGGHLSIVAVQGTQRGRLFLPFVDNDPKTAELISKVLMLSRDKEIKDPNIRQQIIFLTK